MKEALIAIAAVIVLYLVYGMMTKKEGKDPKEGYLADYMKYGFCACRDTMNKRNQENRQ